MPYRTFIDLVSRRAPSIVAYTLVISLVFAWAGVPVWAVTVFAIVLALLALLLFAARGGGSSAPRSNEERSWLAWEVAGKGTPPGSYLLAFFSFLTVFLIGPGSPHARPAWAAFALAVVWGVTNRHYPTEEETDL